MDLWNFVCQPFTWFIVSVTLEIHAAVLFSSFTQLIQKDYIWCLKFLLIGNIVSEKTFSSLYLTLFPRSIRINCEINEPQKISKVTIFKICPLTYYCRHGRGKTSIHHKVCSDHRYTLGSSRLTILCMYVMCPIKLVYNILMYNIHAHIT